MNSFSTKNPEIACATSGHDHTVGSAFVQFFTRVTDAHWRRRHKPQKTRSRWFDFGVTRARRDSAAPWMQMTANRRTVLAPSCRIHINLLSSGLYRRRRFLTELLPVHGAPATSPGAAHLLAGLLIRDQTTAGRELGHSQATCTLTLPRRFIFSCGLSIVRRAAGVKWARVRLHRCVCAVGTVTCRPRVAHDRERFSRS